MGVAHKEQGTQRPRPQCGQGEKAHTMTVYTTSDAWREADKIFPTDYTKDERVSIVCGYPVYFSTAHGVNAWISDLGERLEVNMPDATTVNIWIAPATESQIADALSAANDTLYTLEDKAPSLAAIPGIEEARRALMSVFTDAENLLRRWYPESALFDRYGLER